VSAAFADLQWHLTYCVALGTYTFADDGYSLSVLWPRHTLPIVI
jgi:hypothetical protein